jgi:hypothetical protein
VTPARSGAEPGPGRPQPQAEVVGGLGTFLVFAVVAALIGMCTGIAAIAVHRSGPGWLALAVAASLGVAYGLRSTGTPRLGASYCVGCWWCSGWRSRVAPRATTSWRGTPPAT